VLDDRMKFVKVGDKVKIVFKGMVKNRNGQDVKIFEVFRDVEETKDVKIETY
jgi:hypothetical protein